MRLVAVQMRSVAGAIEGNVERHLRCVEWAASHGGAAVFFPELSLLPDEGCAALRWRSRSAHWPTTDWLTNSSKPGRGSSPGWNCAADPRLLHKRSCTSSDCRRRVLSSWLESR